MQELAWGGPKERERERVREEGRGRTGGMERSRGQTAELLFAKGARRTAGKTPAKRGELLLTANMAANLVGPRASLITSLLPRQCSTFLRFAGALLIA